MAHEIANLIEFLRKKGRMRGDQDGVDRVRAYGATMSARGERNAPR